ncbi:MAG TPA: malectin domain-containing carbohydrate-binding protein, partial [bacterium]
MLSSKIKFLISVLAIFVLSTSLYSQTIIRVNCGGPEYWDTERNLWMADQPYSPGGWGYENPGYMLFTDYPVDGTNDDPLYQWEHNALDNYKFTVPNGTYVVTMKFADLYYDNIGDRIFHVEIEGDRVLNNFDIIAEVGFASACDKTFIIDVTDGVMDILFITIETEPGVTIAHANIKAIGIEEQGTHEPKLWVTPTEIDLFDFSYRRSFKVMNGGELPLEWNCSENPDQTWITDVTPTSGMLYQGQSQYVEVRVTRSGMADGNYAGNISVTSNGGNENVKVLMQVLTKVPSLQVQPTKLNYGAILTKTIFNVKNVGTADLDWTAKSKNSDPWIKTISPTSGRIEPGKFQEVQVTTDRAGLADSTYEGIIAVSSNGGSENVALSLENYNTPLSINCGGGEYSDKNKHIWSNDLGFVGGQTIYSNVEITNTDNDRLYQDARVGMTKYQFAVQKNGCYRVSLHFAELQYDAAGKHLFDVKIEDSLIVQNYDIYAGHGKNYAVIKTANIEVKDQQIDISFIKKTGEPCIAGIEIHQIPFLQVEATDLSFASILTKRNFAVKNLGTLGLNWSAKNKNSDPWLVEISPSSGVLAPFDSQLINVTIDRTNFADSLYQGAVAVETDGGNQNVSLAFETKNKPLRINCGGSDYLDQNKHSWLDDMLFFGGKLTTCQESIANTVDDRLYQTARSGMTKYEFPIQKNGLYKITLHFAEFQHQSARKRIFDVKIEDHFMLENFDIFAQAGGFSALVKSANIEVTDNQLDISFLSKVGEPCISAIEIFQSPVMEIEPAAINFGSLLTRRTFSVINAGTDDLNWAAKNKNNEPWLKDISPTNGVLAPSTTQLVSVTIDRAELTESLYQGSIAIETDGGDQNITL